MSDAQQESQFKDFLNQHFPPLGDINHDSSEKKLRIFTLLGSLSLPTHLRWTHLSSKAKSKLGSRRPAVTVTTLPDLHSLKMNRTSERMPFGRVSLSVSAGGERLNTELHVLRTAALSDSPWAGMQESFRLRPPAVSGSCEGALFVGTCASEGFF